MAYVSICIHGIQRPDCKTVLSKSLYLHGNTCCSQTSRLHPTCHREGGQFHNSTCRAARCSIGVPCSIRGPHTAPSARTGAVTVCNSNVDVATNEGQVEYQRDEGGSHVAREAADKKDPDERIYCADGSDYFDNLEAGWNCDVVVDHSSEEVCVDAHHNDGAHKLDPAEKPLKAFEACDA